MYYTNINKVIFFKKIMHSIFFKFLYPYTSFKKLRANDCKFKLGTCCSYSDTLILMPLCVHSFLLVVHLELQAAINFERW